MVTESSLGQSFISASNVPVEIAVKLSCLDIREEFMNGLLRDFVNIPSSQCGDLCTGICGECHARVSDRAESPDPIGRGLGAKARRLAGGVFFAMGKPAHPKKS